MAEASAAATSSILDSLEETILSDLGIAEVSITSEEKKSLLQAIEERVRPLRCSRGIESESRFEQSFHFRISVFSSHRAVFWVLNHWKVKFIITTLKQGFHRYL
ncbi:hypothetical protein Avbf_15406 [Armadillidium vulgare]|nr:hypothetical protein Avbf_15406 [Armadillidium vulgare]